MTRDSEAATDMIEFKEAMEAFETFEQEYCFEGLINKSDKNGWLHGYKYAADNMKALITENAELRDEIGNAIAHIKALETENAELRASRTEVNALQNLVSKWMAKVFTSEIADNPRQRMQRFLEEALEWFQAEDMSKADAIALVDYVYGRPKGEPEQEIGGVAITTLAACSRLGYSFFACAWREFERVNQPEMIDKIRAKQDVKNAALGISNIGAKKQL